MTATLDPMTTALAPDTLDELIQSALAEDVGAGDVTTDAVIPADMTCRGKIVCKQDGVIAGLSVALAQGEGPASLRDLEERLGRGVAARAALCKEAEAVTPASGGQKGVVAEIVKGAVSGAVGPVVQALQAIYTRSRDEDAQARETIQAQLEAVSWPPFASVAPSS